MTKSVFLVILYLLLAHHPYIKSGAIATPAILPTEGGSPPSSGAKVAYAAMAPDYWGKDMKPVQYCRGPNMEVPMRTMVAPWRMAIGQSWDMPMESSVKSVSCG